MHARQQRIPCTYVYVYIDMYMYDDLRIPLNMVMIAGSMDAYTYVCAYVYVYIDMYMYDNLHILLKMKMMA